MRVTFPFHLMNQAFTPRFVGASLEPQRSINGAETVVPTMGGRWEVDCNFVIKGEAAQLEWQAFLAQMEGRVGTTLVPIHTRFRPNDRDGHGVPFCKIAGLAGAQTWEHFGFANAPVATMTLVDPAPLRATEPDGDGHPDRRDQDHPAHPGVRRPRPVSCPRISWVA